MRNLLYICYRAFVLIMVAIGILWIPIIQNMQGGQLFIYIQAISAYLAPPIAAVYLVAVIWKRGNEQVGFYIIVNHSLTCRVLKPQMVSFLEPIHLFLVWMLSMFD